VVNPRTLLACAAVVVVLTATGVAVADVVRRPPAAAPARPQPSMLPAGPAETAPVAVGADGAQIFCPTGAVPAITVNDAAFEPALHDGRTFGAGTYRIRLRGLVINETTATIAVDAYTVTVGDAVWPAKVSAPTALAAGTAADLTVEGTYDSAGRNQASVHVAMRWDWSATSLRPCGKRGLVEDD
jgi:hypothetical protein